MVSAFDPRVVTSDDPRLRDTTGVDFTSSPAGLDLGTAPPRPRLRGVDFDSALAEADQLANQPLGRPRSTRSSGMFVSNSTGRVAVNGFVFNSDNATDALRSRSLANGPPVQFELPDDASDWRELSRQEYDAYIEGIENPGISRRMGEGFQTAMRGMADIGAGAVLFADPDNEWAQNWRNTIAEGYVRDAPYILNLRQVQEDPSLSVEYVAQLAVQGLPWLVETGVSMAAGALIGAAIGQSGGAVVGANEALVLREAIKASGRQLFRQHLQRGARAILNARSSGIPARIENATEIARRARVDVDDVNRFFRFADRTLNAGRGAAVGMVSSNFATGVGDVRNTLVDAGADPEEAGFAANVIGHAIPYALIESLGDLIITQPLTRWVPGLSNTTARTGRFGDMVAARAGNSARFAGLAFASESTEEVGQQLVLDSAQRTQGQIPETTPTDLLETFLAGGFAGFGMGAVTGALPRPDVRTPPAQQLPPPSTAMPDNSNPEPPQTPPPYEPVPDVEGMQDRLRNMPQGTVAMPGRTVEMEREIARLRAIADDETQPSEERTAARRAIRALRGQTREEQFHQDRAAARTPPPRGVTPVEPIERDPNSAIDQELNTPPIDFSATETPDPAVEQTAEAAMNDRIAAMDAEEARQDANYRQTLADTGRAISALGGRTGRIYDNIARAIAENDFVLDADLSAIKAAIQNDIEKLPAENQAFALVYGEYIQQAAAAQNSELRNVLIMSREMAKDIQAWPAQRLERIAKLAAAAVTKKISRISKADKELLNDLIKTVNQEIQRRRQYNVNITLGKPQQQPQDDLRGRTQEPAAVEKKPKPKPKKYSEDGPVSDAEAEYEGKRPVAFRISDRAKEYVKQGMSEEDALARATKEIVEERDAIRQKGIEEQPKINREREIEKQRREAAENFEDETLYPPPPPNKQIAGRRVKAISKEGTIEEARFVEKDEVLEVDWADDKKIEMKAYTYYVYNGTPVRRDVFEATREPVEGSAYGKSGRFRIKAGVEFDGVIAAKAGKVFTLEKRKTGQSFDAGALILTGVVGERWPQSLEKARGKYTILEEQQEAPKQEAPKQEAPKQEAPKQEAPKQEGKSRIRRAIEQAEKAGVNVAQSARSILQHVRKGHKIAQQWPYVDGQLLSEDELQAILTELKAETPPSTRKSKKTEPEAEAIVPGRSYRTELQRFKEDPKGFDEFVLSDVDAAADFLKTQEAKTFAGLAGRVEKILRDIAPKQAAQPAPPLVVPDITEIAREKPGDSQLVKTRKMTTKIHIAGLKSTIKKIEADNKRADIERAINNVDQAMNTWITAQLPMRGEEGGAYQQLKDLRAALIYRLGEIIGQQLLPKSSFRPGSPAVLEMPDIPRNLYPDLPETEQYIAEIKGIVAAINSGQELTADEVAKGVVNLAFLMGRMPWTDTSAKADSVRRKLADLRDELHTIMTYKDMRPKQSPNSEEEERAQDNPGMSVIEVLRVVTGVQKRINEEHRFNSIHVFKDGADVTSRLHTEMFESATGVRMSLYDYILANAQQMVSKGQHTDVNAAAQEFMTEVFGGSSAMVLPYFDALIVFADVMKSREQLTRILAHEWFGHKGLRVIFDSQQDLDNFMERFGRIPGMEEKYQELIRKFPMYAKLTYAGPEGKLMGLEELIAIAEEQGPNTVEALLSAPEGRDRTTLRTLWEDFSQKFIRWFKDVFGQKISTADLALMKISAALRKYAILGEVTDLNGLIDQYVPDIDPVTGQPWPDRLSKKRPFGKPTDFNQAIAPGSEQARTIEKLFDIEGEAGRPNRPRTWAEHMGGIITSNTDIIEKIQEMGSRGVGTTIKEGWRKAGKFLETTNNFADRSELISKVYGILRNTIETARQIQIERNETRAYSLKAAELAVWRSIFGDKERGSTAAEREAYARMAIIATNGRMADLSEEIIREAPRLIIRHPSGKYSINRTAFEAMLAAHTYSREDFINGIEQKYLGDNNNPQSAGVAKLPKEIVDAGYDIYVKETRHMAESALTTLEHGLIMLGRMNESTVQRMVYESEVADTDAAFTEEVMQRVYQLYTSVAFHDYVNKSRGERRKAREFARRVVVEVLRTFHEKEKVNDWVDKTRTKSTSKKKKDELAFVLREKNATTDPFWSQISWFLGQDAKTGTTRFERIGNLGVTKTVQFRIFGAFQSLLNQEAQMLEFENNVIQSIMGNYVEFSREGEWRVFVQAVMPDGKRADIGLSFSNALHVGYTKGKREAEALQDELQAELAGTYMMTDKNGKDISVRLVAGIERAPRTRSVTEAPNIKQFLEVADILGLKLSAPQMTRVANLVENAGARKRYGLQRQATPGMDIDILRNNSRTMNARAWMAAKMSQAYNLDNVMADDKNLYGDPQLLARLQEQFDKANNDPNRNEALVFLAEQELLRYAWKMKHMMKSTTEKSSFDIRTTKGKQTYKIEPEGRAAQEYAIKLIESLNKDNLDSYKSDLLTATGPFRLFAVVNQLGSAAAGVMNAFASITHLPNVLAAYNERTGYGGGFDYAEVIQGIIQAAHDVGFSTRMVDTAYLKELLSEARAGRNKTRLTIEELEFMLDETLGGELMPTQTTSLSGGAESNLSSVILRNIIDTFMGPFATVEASNRRISSLVSYRLMKQRFIAAGIDADTIHNQDSPEYKKLVAEINMILARTQGDYSNANRAEILRGTLGELVLIYKLFPIMTVQMIYNLPYKNKLVVLGIFFLLGGLKGEPFAEDFMDLYDTLLQKLGIKHDSVELQLIRAIEEVLPGASPYIMRGWLDSITFGGTLSTRVSMGDLIPGTGAFRAGADFGRELETALGPAWSANKAGVEYAFVITQFVAQLMGFEDRALLGQSSADLIRKMPQAQLRGFGEAFLMLRDREITDMQGRLVSDDFADNNVVMAANVFMRALGFYPLEATRANDAVRLDRMHSGYMRVVRSRYVLAWANAYRVGDTATMRNIERTVSEWNEWARDANREDMMITNFRRAAQQSGEAAREFTAAGRASESGAAYSIVDEIAGYLNADEEPNE